jgi:hypothetical protein
MGWPWGALFRVNAVLQTWIVAATAVSRVGSAFTMGG